MSRMYGMSIECVYELYAAFMDLEKAYDRVDREALWNVLYIYGVGGQLLKGIQSFYREANACVRVGGEFVACKANPLPP